MTKNPVFKSASEKYKQNLTDRDGEQRSNRQHNKLWEGLCNEGTAGMMERATGGN